MSSPHKGGCLCSAITFEAGGAPKWVAHCHCNSCRRNTGAPVTTFVGFEKERFTWTGEEPQMFESTPGVYRKYCGACGTPLTYEADRCDDEVHVYISTLEQPDDYPATTHVFAGEKISWLELDDDIPRFRGGAREGETPMPRKNR
jgi:hypothetical protein